MIQSDRDRLYRKIDQLSDSLIKSMLVGHLKDDKYIDSIVLHKDVQLVAGMHRVLNNHLSDLEAKIIRLSFGIHDNREYSDREIGYILEYNPKYVNNVKRAALRKLKQDYVKSELVIFLE